MSYTSLPSWFKTNQSFRCNFQTLNWKDPSRAATLTWCRALCVGACLRASDDLASSMGPSWHSLKKTNSSSHPVGLTLTGRSTGARCNTQWVAGKGGERGMPTPGTTGWPPGCGTSPLGGDGTDAGPEGGVLPGRYTRVHLYA